VYHPRVPSCVCPLPHGNIVYLQYSGVLYGRPVQIADSSRADGDDARGLAQKKIDELDIVLGSVGFHTGTHPVGGGDGRHTDHDLTFRPVAAPPMRYTNAFK